MKPLCGIIVMKMMRKTPIKQCKEHERRWRDLCVDKNLDDEWLERLNKLKAFRLVGICEGHSNRHSNTVGAYPNIHLKLRATILEGVAGKWPSLKAALLKDPAKIFIHDDTKTRFELNFRLRSGKGKLVYQEEMKVRVIGIKKRKSDEMGDEVRIWFEDCIDRIEEMDQAVYTWHKEMMDT